MQRPLIGVIIGGRSDFNVMRRGLETLRVMGVPYLFEVISPHRNPQRLSEFARNAGENGIEILIAAEGGSSLIANHMAAHTTLPIIGVPIDASPLRGQDSLFSLVMLPPGMPVASVGINNSENAAILATQILALKHPHFRTVLAHRRMFAAQRTEAIQNELYAEYPDLCEPARTAPLKPSEESNDTEVGSESITPEVPEESDRIRPGAVYVDPKAGPRVESLVSTPVPQEPGASGSQTPAPTVDMLLKGSQMASEITPSVPGSHPDLQTPQAFDSLNPTEESTIEESYDSEAENLTEDQEDELPIASHSFNESTEEVEVGQKFPRPEIIRNPEAGNQTPDPPIAPAKVDPPKKSPSSEQNLRFEQDEDTASEEVENIEEPAATKTKIFKVNREEPSEDLVDHAMMVLLEGGIIGLPTDTVYGLACDATNEDAVQNLYQLKGKDAQKTLGVLIHHPDMLDSLVTDVPPALEKVIEECWPGALTIILPKNPTTLSKITKFDRIGVRIPSDQLCLSVIEKVGRPIVVRNASLTANEPMHSAEKLIESFDGLIDCILDGGDCSSSAGASTVLTALGEEFEILREGGVSRRKLRELLGSKLKG